MISICSPTHAHAADIQSALALQPKLIFCEKPVTSNLQESQRAVQACADQHVLLAVNYGRRWSPQVTQLKAELTEGYWGAVRSVSAVYNKGQLNNGSHMTSGLIAVVGAHDAKPQRLFKAYQVSYLTLQQLQHLLLTCIRLCKHRSGCLLNDLGACQV